MSMWEIPISPKNHKSVTDVINLTTEMLFLSPNNCKIVGFATDYLLLITVMNQALLLECLPYLCPFHHPMS